MEVDPAASFRIWGVDLDLGGRTFSIPPLPAADWLPMLMAGRVLDVLDLIDDPDTVDDLIATGEVGPDDIRESSRSVIEQMAGRDPDAAMVIARTAMMAWPVIGGDLARQGVRIDEIPLGAALDALYVIIVRNLKPEPLKQFRAALETPGQPGMRGRPSRQAAEAQMEAEIGPKPAPAPVPAPASGAPSAGARPKTRQQLRQRPRADR